MKKLIIVCILGIFIAGCSKGDDSNNNGGGGGGGLVAQAIYRITFSPDFTSTSHPTDYPANAMFAKMFLVAHSNTTTIFRLGQLASPGLELYAEDGDTSLLETEHMQVEDNVNPTIIRIGMDIGPTATDVAEITITPSTTRISFVSKISPSPDWIVGVDAFNLVNPDNSLVDEIEISLFPIDVGTDAGTTYTSDDVEESQLIAVINDAPFTDGGTPSLVNRMGTLTIKRIDQNE